MGARCTRLTSGRRYWWLKLRALAEIKDWNELETFSKSKKSPIGYEPFVRHLVSKGYGKQGATYVPKCDASKRGELYALCGDYRAAGKEYKERGDKAGLTYVFITRMKRVTDSYLSESLFGHVLIDWLSVNCRGYCRLLDSSTIPI